MAKKNKKNKQQEQKVEVDTCDIKEYPIVQETENKNQPVQDNLDNTESKEKIIAHLIGEHVTAEELNETRELYNKNRYGEPQDNKTFQYSLHEALYLLERGKFKVLDLKDKELTQKEFIKRAIKVEPNFWIRYCVYKDLRKRGYIVKTALKFGADFRVYDRGVKPGEDHAKWIVYPVSEGSVFSWHEFSAKNRVAHSTKKSLLIAIVDAENESTYYTVNWLRP